MECIVKGHEVGAREVEVYGCLSCLKLPVSYCTEGLSLLSDNNIYHMYYLYRVRLLYRHPGRRNWC